MNDEERDEFQVMMKDVTPEQATTQLCVTNKTFELGKTRQPNTW